MMWGSRLHTEHGSRLETESSRARKRRGLAAGLVIASLLSSLGPAKAGYTIAAGDVIEILVARVPELQRRVTVQPDGRISFPVLGSVAVAGLSASEMESRIQAMMASKVFRQRSSDGREYVVAIEADEVTASVAQYRPVYIKGDVSKPGELPFRPQMTVRHLVAVSGGYDLLRQRTGNPALLSVELSNESQWLWLELARSEARVLRLQATLGDAAQIAVERLTPSPIPSIRIAEIEKLETDQLRAEQSDHDREKSYLNRSIKLADQQAKVLAAQEAKEEQGTQADIEELRKVEEMFGKGALPSPRVTDARRAVLLSSTRKLQTGAQLMEVKKRQDEYARQLERLDDRRRIKLLQDLHDARTALNQIRVRLQTVEEKLSSLARGHKSGVEVAIVRRGEKGLETIIANEDFELQPGDVVEVTLQPEASPGLVRPSVAGVAAGAQAAAKTNP
ncbi:Polysaccharide export protein precursor [Bosea sp. LC85]|uniref:polysaccharide biosynthesis/export family protein n=1 Tax=Bosea sp. LC85 TaxID=1502851 RepID=UPI0004E3F68D|nr:polysaccharide biosynthesis/export family protein [Bosea sp. LC85]KFC70985.1 Polysaccharide export protein precursor [Bosea sp. LC85]